MKRTGNLFKNITSFENVLSASRKARKEKRFKYNVALFELELEKNIFKIIEVLQNKTYSPGTYKDFFIYYPKKRVISAAPYFDRVVHHTLINILEPVLSCSFIFDTYACIKNKGTHKAVYRYKQFLKKNTYVLKCDIKKFFFNIDHEILLDKIKKKIKCKDTLWLIKTILSSKLTGHMVEQEYFPGDDLFTPFERKKGIPIGNLTSQFFANFYLNDFDHFVKEILKARYYIRYCDDFVVFGNDKPWLNNVKTKMSNYLANLRLHLHKNKSRIFRVADGVDFLGYRIFPNFIKVKKANVKRFRKRLRNFVYLYSKNRIDIKHVSRSIRSWIGYIIHADSYRLRSELLGKTVFKRAEQGAEP